MTIKNYLNIKVESFNDVVGGKVLGIKEVATLIKKDIEFINQDSMSDLPKYIGTKTFEEVQRMYNKAVKESKERVVRIEFTEDYEYDIEPINLLNDYLVETGAVSVQTIIALSKAEIETLSRENLDKAVDVVGKEALKNLINNNQSYVKYSKDNDIFCLVKKDVKLKIGYVTWDTFSITDATKADLSKFKDLEGIEGIEYLGQCSGKSDTKSWHADFMIEDDGNVEFFNARFNIGKTKVRDMVRELRKEVNKLEFKFVEVQQEEKVVLASELF